MAVVLECSLGVDFQVEIVFDLYLFWFKNLLGVSCFDEVKTEATTVPETPDATLEAKTDAAAVAMTVAVTEVIYCFQFSFRWL